MAALAVIAAMPSAALAAPPGRGYELVTPVDKPSELAADNQGYYVGITSDGNHVLFHTETPVVAGTDRAPRLLRVDRGKAEWTTHEVPPAGEGLGLGMTMLAYSDALDVVSTSTRSFDPQDDDDPFFSSADYYRFSADRSATFMSPNLALSGPTSEEKLFLGATKDLSGIVFRVTGAPMLPGDGSNDVQRLYEFRDGTLRRVDVDDAGNYLSLERSQFGAAAGASGFNAYSEDGSRVFFTSFSSGDPADRPGLYVRLDGETTLPVPAAPAGANASSLYVGATPDGRRAFFVSDQQLTPDDDDGSPDLYAFDTVTQDVSRLSDGPVDAGAVASPVWASRDGERVWFTATGRLVPGMGSADGLKTYVYDNGELKFVADAQLIPVPPQEMQDAGPQCGPTRVSPDGRYLLAQTTAAVTPDDNDGGAADVYRFDAVSGEAIRVSTGPADGGEPLDAVINPPNWNGTFPGCTFTSDMPSRAMSEDGGLIFFQTRAPLDKADANGQWDVYVWDATTGATSLVTSGTSDDRSDFLNATPDGSSVVFTTRERLVAADRDEQVDIYVARVGGGFPEPPAPPTPCRESECQGAPRPGPQIGSPSSTTLVAPVPDSERRPPKIGKLAASRLSAAALRRLLRTGRATVRVRAARSGTLGVVAGVTVKGRTRGVARVSRKATAGSTVSITLRLDARERRLLARHHRLVVRVHQSGVKDVVTRYRVPAAGSTR